jgi:hypothetical protein
MPTNGLLKQGLKARAWLSLGGHRFSAHLSYRALASQAHFGLARMPGRRHEVFDIEGRGRFG